MKTTLTTYEIAKAISTDDYNNFSYKEAELLAEYLEEMEESTGEEMELDIVAIRCDFNVSGVKELKTQYNIENDLDKEDLLDTEKIFDWLNYRTLVVGEVDGKFIYQSF